MRLGYVKLHRKLLDSRVFQNPDLLKVWIWCLLRASHEGQWVPVKTGRGETETWLHPGEFIFGRCSAAKALNMPPSTVRRKISRLQSLEQISIKTDNHFSIISIVNWESYQSKPGKRNRLGTAKGQAGDTDKNEQECKEENILTFSSLGKRYRDQDLIEQAFDAIRSTRKSGKVADSVFVNQLRKWERYPPEQVEAGIRTYLEKGYADQGKDEKYLLGIIKKTRQYHGEEDQGWQLS